MVYKRVGRGRKRSYFGLSIGLLVLGGVGYF